MLVLSRKVGERIWIGNEICVTVVRLTSGGVRLGIEAPAELPVIREELKVRQSGEALESDAMSAAPQLAEGAAEQTPSQGSFSGSERFPATSQTGKAQGQPQSSSGENA